MNSLTVELSSTKWLSPERAAELGTVTEPAESETETVDNDVPNFETVQEENESFLKTLVLALFLGVAAFGAVFAFPTGNTDAKAAPVAVEVPVEEARESSELDAGFSDTGESGELSDAEVMELAGEIMQIKLRNAKAGK